MILKSGKIKHKVFTSKTQSGYNVTEMTFDEFGNTVNHRIHNCNLSFKDATTRVHEIINTYR